MEDQLEAIEAEALKLLNTVSVVRALKPIQRQVPECEALLRERVECLRDIVEPPVVAVEPSGIDLTGSSNVGADAQRGEPDPDATA